MKISRQHIGYVIHKYFSIRKLCAKWGQRELIIDPFTVPQINENDNKFASIGVQIAFAFNIFADSGAQRLFPALRLKGMEMKRN